MGRRRKTTARTDTGPVDLPAPLASTLAELIGDEVDLLREALQQPPPTSIRIHPAKGFDPGGIKVPWCSTGRYLSSRPAFTFDPLLHAGAYYVQEAGSMLLEQALLASGMLERDILALDLCAAPGGKSTHLRSLLSTDSLLVANEVDRDRQGALQENLWKWGGANVVVTGSDPQDLARLPDHFDLIVVDAPCSGEGMFRKDPFAREQWSPDLVEHCARVQQGIVERAWTALSPGGILIYSTCTWEPIENELQLVPLLQFGAVSIPMKIDPEWGFAGSTIEGITGYRAYPHRVAGEGFFLAMVKKPGELPERSVRPLADKSPLELPALIKGVPLHHTERNGVQHVVGERWGREVQELGHSLRTLAPGIPVAEKKGNDWTPHPALALNELLDRTSVPHVELEVEQAITYLRGNALGATDARGAALATFGGLPLGWLHGAGNRWNNRHPLHWRIRSHGPPGIRVEWDRS
jgi:16S rRNA C967 or C1407 C5-methylase (RsmB/RsmF family)/NOL1/NOP2/fmu family ribosome biogenesis protein